jgi:hypothetical protein
MTEQSNETVERMLKRRRRGKEVAEQPDEQIKRRDEQLVWLIAECELLNKRVARATEGLVLIWCGFMLGIGAMLASAIAALIFALLGWL